MDNSYLQHHGILGMRWGVRRYQNKDGTLTPAGKRHVAKLQAETEYLGGEKAVARVKAATKPTVKTEPKQEEIQKPKYTGQNERFNGPNGELLAEKERLETMRDIKNLQSQLNPATKDYAQDFMDTFGDEVVQIGSKKLASFLTDNVFNFLQNKIGVDAKAKTGIDASIDKIKAETSRLEAIAKYKKASKAAKG